MSKQETSALWQVAGVDGFLSTPFTIQELMLAIRQLKIGKGSGTRQYPSRIAYPLWPQDVWNGSGGFLLQLFLKPDHTQDLGVTQ